MKTTARLVARLLTVAIKEQKWQDIPTMAANHEPAFSIFMKDDTAPNKVREFIVEVREVV